MVCLTLRVLTRKVNFFKLRGGNHTSRPVVIETTHSKFCFQVLRNSDGGRGWSRPNREVKNPMIVTATHFQPQSFLIFSIGSLFSWIRQGSSRGIFSEKSGGVPHHRRCSIVLGKFSREIFIDLRRDGCDKRSLILFKCPLWRRCVAQSWTRN